MTNQDVEEDGGVTAALTETNPDANAGDDDDNDDDSTTTDEGEDGNNYDKYSPEDRKMIDYLLSHGMEQAAKDLQKKLDEKLAAAAATAAAEEEEDSTDTDSKDETTFEDAAMMTTAGTTASPAQTESFLETPPSASHDNDDAPAVGATTAAAGTAATSVPPTKPKKSGGTGTFFKKMLGGGIKVPKLGRGKSKGGEASTTISNPPSPDTHAVTVPINAAHHNQPDVVDDDDDDQTNEIDNHPTPQQSTTADVDTDEAMVELDDLSEVDMADLDNLLDNLDIDRDYQCWTSFRQNMTRRADEMDEGPTPDEEMLETEDIEHWQVRLEREEVFSHRYHPTKAETKELHDVALIVHPGHNSIMNTFFSTATGGADSSNNEALFKRLVYPDLRKSPASILIKRGPVLYETTYNNEITEQEAELVLLTHGCIISTVVPPEEQTESERNKGNGVVRKFDRAIEWKSLVCVAPNEDDDLAFELVIRGTKGQERLTFVTGTERQAEAWMNALETVVVKWHMHTDTSVKHLGWQYRLVHKSGFTLAVTNVEDDLGFSSATLRTLDSYNGYAPIHYAVRLGNEHAVTVFLAAGVDPNITDEDGLTPVYHAVQDEVDRSILELLEAAGATKDIKKAQHDKEELFDRVVATNHQREEREQKKAMAAQAKMNENMRLLHERGQKIEDASDKAREMNENAAEYADLARQLKEKTKKQASWNPFK